MAAPQESRLTRWLAAATFGLLVVALVFGVAEFAARALLPAPESPNRGGRVSDAFSWRRPAPYVGYRATPNADVIIRDKPWVSLRREAGEGENGHVVTDEHGFRYAGDLNEPRQPGELRVFLLGGSVVVNGMTNESTICGYLEERIQSCVGDARRVRCVTAGLQTGVSDQLVAILIHEVADHDPDIVIALDGFNDVYARRFADPRLGYPTAWMAQEPGLLAELDAAEQLRAAFDRIPTWQLLLARSRLVTWIAPGLALDDALTADAVRELEVDHPKPEAEAIVDHLIANWRKLELISEGTGARFFAVVQPMSPSTRAHAEFAPSYDLLARRVEVLRSEGAPIHSFDRRFDDRPELFYDPVHTYDAGNEIIAGWLFELLLAEGALAAPNEVEER